MASAGTSDSETPDREKLQDISHAARSNFGVEVTFAADCPCRHPAKHG